MTDFLGDMESMLDEQAVFAELAVLAQDEVGADMTFIGDLRAPETMILRHLVGARTSSIQGLAVAAGRGVGGKALLLGRPCWVHSYSRSRAITHDFDGPVSDEQLQAVVAVPILISHSACGVLYAGFRDQLNVADRGIRQLERVAALGAAHIQVARDTRARVQLAVDAERRRIAAELHDSLSAALFSVGAQLRDLRGRFSDDDPLASRLGAIETQLTEASSTLRHSLTELHQIDAANALAVSVKADCHERGTARHSAICHGERRARWQRDSGSRVQRRDCGRRRHGRRGAVRARLDRMR